MMWVLVCCLALVVGFIFFSELQPSIPEELGFLKMESGTSALIAPSTPSQVPQALTGGWQIRADGNAVELYKSVTAGPVAGAAVYDPPVVAFMCDGKTLYARVDSIAKTTGVQSSEVAVGGAAAAWPKGQDQNLLAPNAKVLLRQLTKASGIVNITLSYVEMGEQTLSFDTRGLSQAVGTHFPAECR